MVYVYRKYGFDYIKGIVENYTKKSKTGYITILGLSSDDIEVNRKEFAEKYPQAIDDYGNHKFKEGCEQLGLNPATYLNPNYGDKPNNGFEAAMMKALNYNTKDRMSADYLTCVNCGEEDYDRQTLFEYPKDSWDFWCACCFDNIVHKEWDKETNRWKKIRCECHDEIEVFDEDNNEWVCPQKGE
tara:strand:- start:568 stop:1122 length:555 start_codon:yes stop_codon:yes gene_type:complete